MTASTQPDDRRIRDLRINELAAQGWSNAAIGSEVGLTKEGVRKIRRQLAAGDALAAHENNLKTELDELLRHEEANRRRIRAVRRALERIEEEREVARIDALLGLT